MSLTEAREKEISHRGHRAHRGRVARGEGNRWFYLIKPTFLSVPSVRSSEASERVRDAPGFSLIEVLVAMAVMIVIIVMVTNMFRDSSEAWDTGVQRADMNTSARAAVDYIARELSCAMAGSMPNSAGGTTTLKPFKLAGGNELSFAALSGANQALRGISFKFDSANYCIQAARDETVGRSYDANPYDWEYQLLITNVWRFEVTVCTNESDMLAGNAVSAYELSVLPACLDITIEMLSEQNMARALSLSGAAQDGYVMTNSRVYATRVYFPNRSGGER